MTSSSAKNWDITLDYNYHTLHNTSGDFASSRISQRVCIRSYSNKNTLCSLLCLPLSPHPLSLSVPLSSSWYSNMCNGINTLLRWGGERTEMEKRREDEAMEELGEEERKVRKRGGLRVEEGAGVPGKENKCIEERQTGGWALSISLLLAYRRSERTFRVHLNFGAGRPPLKLHLHTVRLTYRQLSINTRLIWWNYQSPWVDHLWQCVKVKLEPISLNHSAKRNRETQSTKIPS